jgi:hypothetical protein
VQVRDVVSAWPLKRSRSLEEMTQTRQFIASVAADRSDDVKSHQ